MRFWRRGDRRRAVKELGDHERNHYVGVWGVQAPELLHHQEQAKYHRSAGTFEVLPLVPQAHDPPGNEVIRWSAGLRTPSERGMSGRRPWSLSGRGLRRFQGPWIQSVGQQACSSNGRAADSKSAGWGFESLQACHAGPTAIAIPPWAGLSDIAVAVGIRGRSIWDR